MISFFTTTKPFKGKFRIIQRNAIKSWKILHPNVEVILFDDTKEGEKIAEEIGLILIKEMKKNKYGTPLLNYLFEKAQEIAKNRIMCYINADIILLKDFLDAVNMVKNNEKFLLVGKRYDLDFDREIDFSRQWEKEMIQFIRKYGVLHRGAASDYFVFPKGLFTKIPPFAIGRGAFDNWLIYDALRRKIPVIDATHFITAIHQNHDYSHCKWGERWGKSPEYEENVKLAGKGTIFEPRDATHILTKKGIRMNLNFTQLHRKIDVIERLYPHLFVFKIVLKGFINILKKMGIRRRK